RPWRDLAELQMATDAAVRRSAERRICPATGLRMGKLSRRATLLESAVSALARALRSVAQRRVGRDLTVAFEGRTYSVPFRFAGQVVEARGCAAAGQVWAEGQIVASHPRHTRGRLLLDPAHYDGPSTERVAAPVPLGRMGRKLQEIWAMAPERRPIDYYAACAEVAR